MKDKPVKTPTTALQERIADLLGAFYADDDKSAVLACFQEGEGLNITIRGSQENIATALHQMLQASEEFYQIAVHVVGNEVAARMPRFTSRKLVEGFKHIKHKS